jgi:hypothetical protein
MYISVKYMIQPEVPPKPVRVAGMLEAAFGTLIWGTLCFVHNNLLKIFFMLLGLFWIGVAVSLYRGSKVGRTTCLVLSILRIPTVIGAFFSLFSLYKLYFIQESKDFFNKKIQASGNDFKSNDSVALKR